ncbi:MAG: DUF927 domain-containing protein [Saccharofermentans sp.]|nr:DUF927 domain-containing protein [Saccharofermentans sp.]
MMLTDVELKDEMHPHAKVYAGIEHYYINKKGMLTYQSGDNTTPLCYGSIIVTAEIVARDGTEDNRLFQCEGITQKGYKLPPVIVSASELDSLTWIRKAWGSSIIVTPGTTTGKKLVTGILLTARKAEQKTVYTHTGYITRNGVPFDYMSYRGSLLHEDYQSDIEKNLSRYNLAGCSRDVVEQVTAINASLNILDCHEPRVTAPLFAFIYLAPILPIVSSVIDESGFCLYLQGKTQSGKSTLAAFACSHFGSFSSVTPPVSFNSTANYINELAFILKDSILWIDDYHPQGTRAEADKQNQIFQRIARSAGDNSSRGRLNSSAKLQTSHPARCLFLVTGEDVPAISQSGSARVFTVEVTRSRKDISKLRRDARTGILSRAMSDYISYVISNYEPLKEAAEALYQDIKDKQDEKFGECRLSTQTSLLLLSSRVYLDYVVRAGAITEDRARKIYTGLESYISDNAREHEEQIALEDPCKMYLTALSNLISSGRRYVIPLNGNPNREDHLSMDNTVLGWRDEKYYYLDGNVSYSAVSDYYEDEHIYFNIHRLTLQKRLIQEGYTVPDGSKNPTITKSIYGRNVRVLRFTRRLIDGKGGDA